MIMTIDITEAQECVREVISQLTGDADPAVGNELIDNLIVDDGRLVLSVDVMVDFEREVLIIIGGSMDREQ